MTRGRNDLTSDQLRAVAKNALVEVAASPKSTPSARAQAARTLLELIGDLKAGQPDAGERGLHELSEAELDAELARLGGLTDAVSVEPLSKPKRKQALSKPRLVSP